MPEVVGVEGAAIGDPRVPGFNEEAMLFGVAGAGAETSAHPLSSAISRQLTRLR